MADTGYNWSAWDYVQKSSTDWNDDALADAATETSDEIDLDGKAACEIGVKLIEDNTGAIDGTATIYVLGATGDDGGGSEEWEEPGVGSPWSFTLTPVQNDTVKKRFSVDPAHYGKCKVAVFNDAGQELAVTVEYRTAEIPAAS